MASTFTQARLDALASVELDHPWSRARRTMLTGLVERERRAGPATIVDVGCGTGLTLQAVARPHDTPIGLDLLPGQSDVRGGLGRVVADVRHLPLAAGVADVVLACDVLEHVVEDDRAAREVARILRPDGVAVVTVPAREGLWSHRDDDAGHVRRYDRGGLQSVLEQAGLDVLQMSGFAVTTLPGVAIMRSVGRSMPVTRDLEERPGRGVFGRSLGAVLAVEARAIVSGRRLPTGSSLVAVARSR